LVESVWFGGVVRLAEPVPEVVLNSGWFAQAVGSKAVRCGVAVCLVGDGQEALRFVRSQSTANATASAAGNRRVSAAPTVPRWRVAVGS
jgi:hypothetical protein